MGEFRDAIAGTADDFGANWQGEGDPNEGFADAILAMPEMQAIKAFIDRMANGRYGPKMDKGRRQMEIWNLPESIVEWVLGGVEQP